MSGVKVFSVSVCKRLWLSCSERRVRRLRKVFRGMKVSSLLFILSNWRVLRLCRSF